MLTTGLDIAIRWRMNGIISSGQRYSEDPALVRNVYDHFRKGITAGLNGIAGEKINALETGVPWEKRLFFWEGYAFGLCCQHACFGRSGNPFKLYPAPGFRFMFWTGLGFWNGASKPMPAVSLAPSFWADVPEFEEEYPLILGGSSFALIAQMAGFDKHRVEALPGIRNAADLDGVYLGVGRALWFLYTRNHSKLAAILDEHPERAQDIARGLGVAITLTQLDAPERVLAEFAKLPEVYWPQLLAGNLMAFTCLLMDDPRAAGPLSRFPTPLDALITETQSNIASYGGPGWTTRFAELGERYIEQWNGLQPPVTASTKAAPERIGAK
jgi:hypothetical protein